MCYPWSQRNPDSGIMRDGDARSNEPEQTGIIITWTWKKINYYTPDILASQHAPRNPAMIRMTGSLAGPYRGYDHGSCRKTLTSLLLRRRSHHLDHHRNLIAKDEIRLQLPRRHCDATYPRYRIPVQYGRRDRQSRPRGAFHR